MCSMSFGSCASSSAMAEMISSLTRDGSLRNVSSAVQIGSGGSSSEVSSAMRVFARALIAFTAAERYVN